MVLGAGIVGTSIALHLAKRGLPLRWSTGRRRRETSYGNTGVIEGSTSIRIRFHAHSER